jgi:hypothetical protein
MQSEHLKCSPYVSEHSGCNCSSNNSYSSSKFRQSGRQVWNLNSIFLGVKSDGSEVRRMMCPCDMAASASLFAEMLRAAMLD